MALGYLIYLLSFTRTALTAPPHIDHHQEKRALSSFDYVIVGGGTAGLALANRLSASASIQVACNEHAKGPLAEHH
jgi:hypothetical protein